MEDNNGISYEMLQDLLRSERRSNKLMPVPTKFWTQVRTFLDEVTAVFRQEQEKDPFSRRVMMATDEVKHARQAAEGIWALRERKMALYALAQVREAAPKRPESLTPREERIYDAILATLKEGRSTVLEGHVHSPEAAPPAKRDLTKSTKQPKAAPEAETEEPEGRRRPAMPDEPLPPDLEPKRVEVPSDTRDDDMVTIRALSDIPAFVGPDMQTYLLKEGDVATVPKAIARLLARRKKAEEIEALV